MLQESIAKGEAIAGMQIVHGGAKPSQVARSPVRKEIMHDHVKTRELAWRKQFIGDQPGDESNVQEHKWRKIIVDRQVKLIKLLKPVILAA